MFTFFNSFILFSVNGVPCFSKSNDFDIQQIVVRMKDELEKLKEQLANIL